MYNTRYSCPILMKLDFFYSFSKNIQMYAFMKIRPVGAELFDADGRREVQANGKTGRS